MLTTAGRTMPDPADCAVNGTGNDQSKNDIDSYVSHINLPAERLKIKDNRLIA
jgi:hypothetical protein